MLFVFLWKEGKKVLELVSTSIMKVEDRENNVLTKIGYLYTITMEGCCCMGGDHISSIYEVMGRTIEMKSRENISLKCFFVLC